LQQQLIARQKLGLTLALLTIFLLASVALVLRTPAPQVLCPVAVFLMIQYLDHLRKSERTFQFASLRLAAETLRVLGAARDKPALIDLIVSTRGLSSYPVADLSAQACEASRDLPGSDADKAVTPVPADHWGRWLNDQTAYYAHASSRERLRGKQGLWVFNAAFTCVALIGLGACMWSLLDATAVASDLFRVFMATASVLGSCGLAYINFVKDRKAFDQSLDYDRMHKVFTGTLHPRVSERAGEPFERMVVTESLNEHMRWALRMAGHFKATP
jgi:hypothetical protein